MNKFERQRNIRNYLTSSANVSDNLKMLSFFEGLIRERKADFLLGRYLVLYSLIVAKSMDEQFYVWTNIGSSKKSR